MSEDLAEQLERAVHHLRAGAMVTPRVLIAADREMIGPLRSALDAVETLPYALVPGFPACETASGGACVTLGRWGETPVGVVPGAESHAPCTLRWATLPVRAFRRLGAEVLIGLGAGVATDDSWVAGEVMLIDDHINLLGDNPLRGPNDGALGPRFPDMSEAYDRQLAEAAMEAARHAGVVLRRGVYAAAQLGARPTPAERRMLRTLGADVIGGGVVPDVIVARHMGMRVLGLCAIDGQAANTMRALGGLIGRLA